MAEIVTQHMNAGETQTDRTDKLPGMLLPRPKNKGVQCAVTSGAPRNLHSSSLVSYLGRMFSPSAHMSKDIHVATHSEQGQQVPKQQSGDRGQVSLPDIRNGGIELLKHLPFLRLLPLVKLSFVRLDILCMLYTAFSLFCEDNSSTDSLIQAVSRLQNYV